MGSICITQYFALSKVSTLYAGPFILKSPTNCLIKGGNNEKANTADQEVVVIGPYSASNQCNRKSSEKCFRYLCLVNDNDKFHFISFVRRWTVCVLKHQFTACVKLYVPPLQKSDTFVRCFFFVYSREKKGKLTPCKEALSVLDWTWNLSI